MALEVHDAAPTGEVALVFTDVQDSTARWETDPGGMHAALALHNRVMRAQLAAHGGYEVKTEGDAFMVAFGEPAAAVRWCLSAQAALRAAPWPGARLRVRMGGHRGTPACERDPVTGRMDYFGPVVNRAARVGAAAHGDQIVLTRALFDAAGPPPGVRGRGLGVHRLRGLRSPERLVQVEDAAGPQGEFPALRTESSDRVPLPAEPGPLLGRGPVLEAVWAGWRAGTRTLSLVGPGGVGKTRLALHIAHVVAREDAPDGGTWWVDLLPCRTAGDVLGAVAARLGVPLPAALDEAGRQAALVAGIAGRDHVLVVLDNAEHVWEAVRGLVSAVESGAPRAWFLLTTRVPLRTDHEQVVPVAALAVDSGVALLEARARRAAPGWRLSGPERAAAARLVERLDGWPLALELVASWLPTLGVDGVLARLAEGGAPAPTRADGRSASLEATLAWSWELLTPDGRDVLCALSVFRGPFHPDDAAAVLGAGHGAALALLVEHSLVEVRADDGALRLYRTVRAFAAGRLEAVLGSGRVASVRRAHAVWASRFGALGRTWLAHSDADRALLARLPAHRADLHAAWRWARDTRDAALETRLALALGFFHLRIGPYAGGREPLEAALALPVLRVGDAVDLRLLLAHLLSRQGDAAASEATLRDGLGGATGEDRARLLLSLTMALRVQGRIPAASACLAEARAALPDDADAGVVGNLENNAGILATHRSAPAEAEACFLRALRGFAEAGLHREQGLVALNLSGELATRGQPGRAQPLIDEAVRLARTSGDLRFLLYAVGNAGLMAARHGDLDAGWEQLLEAERRGRAAGDDMAAGAARLSQASVLLRRALPEAGLAAARDARACFRRSASAYWVAASSLDLALALCALGRAAEAAEPLAEGRAWFAENGDPAGVARMDYGEAVRRGALGEPGAAQAMVAAREACLRHEQAQEAAAALLWLGRHGPVAARPARLAQAVAEAAAARLHREHIGALVSLGSLQVAGGARAAGMAHLREAVERARSTHRRAREAEARLALARALRMDGAVAEAALELDDAARLCRTLQRAGLLAEVRAEQAQLRGGGA